MKPFLLTFAALSLLFIQTVKCQDYFVIVHEDLYSSAWYNALSDLKTKQGYTVDYLLIIDTETDSDIQQYIEDEDPDFVLLIGDANEEPSAYRYKVKASHGNFIPFHYELMDDIYHNGLSAIATDDYYIQNLPNARIGRIPAETVQEVTNWVNKLVTHSKVQSYGSWRNRALFATGNFDHPTNGGRGKYREMLRDSLIINYVEANNYITDTLNSKSIDPSAEGYDGHDPARPHAFENKINTGCAVVNTIGVGADWSFLVNFYWTSPHSPEPDWDFTNQNKYPFLFGFSCSIGRIQRFQGGQEFDTVMEKLLFLPNAGIIGGVAATWIMDSRGNRIFTNMFYDKIFNNNYSSIGNALKATKAEFETQESDLEWQSRATLLFGDPSMALPLFQRVSGSISSNTTWQGAILVENDVTVQSGVTLTILPGTGVFFNSGKKLRIYGTLVAQGTSNYPITFDRAGTSGSWYGILFENSSVDASCIVKYADIKHASYGIYCYHASPRIENNDISSCTQGIYAYYQNPRIKNNKIHNNTSNGVQLRYVSKHTDNLRNNSIYSNGNYGFYNYRGNTYLADNLIYYNDSHGIYTYYAFLWMDGYDYDNGYAHNVMAYNSGYGVHTISTTERYGYSDEGEEGQNSFYGNNTYELYGSCGTGEAEAQWWGTTEEEEIGEIVTCIDSYWNWLMSDPNPPISPPLPKAIAMSDGRGFSHSGFNPDCPEQASSPADPSLKELWRQTRRFKKEGNYSQALEILDQIISDYSSSKAADNALICMKSVFEAMRISDKAAIASLESNAERYSGTDLGASALEMTIGYLVDAGNSEEAITRCNDVITEYPAATVNRDARFHLWNIYWYDLGETDKAASVLEEYLKVYGDDDLSVDMRLQMGLISPEEAVNIQRSLSGAGQVANRITEDIPEEFSLSANFPNPFNPSTTIRYDLPEDTHVSLVIYDILGRELVRLVDGWIASGYQNVVWNGKDNLGREVPTGIYIARMVTPKYSKNIKMLLMK